MANILNAPTRWANESTTKTHKSIWAQWMALADAQAKNQTLWFLFSLVFQGVLFLPVPALLIFYYHAPLVVLGITMVLFFANIIAGMGGSGIRVMLSLFVASVIIHLVMLAIFIL
ncbi:MAG TPA: hypothetical protein VGC01_02395 [Mucilaginibacter sp.]